MLKNLKRMTEDEAALTILGACLACPVGCGCCSVCTTLLGCVSGIAADLTIWPQLCNICVTFTTGAVESCVDAITSLMGAFT